MNLANDTFAIFDAALALTREKRAVLLRELLISLEPDMPKDPEYHRLLREEFERCWAMLDRGNLISVDWQDLMREIRQALHARKTA
jgi:hypothetical protein